MRTPWTLRFSAILALLLILTACRPAATPAQPTAAPSRPTAASNRPTAVRPQATATLAPGLPDKPAPPAAGAAAASTATSTLFGLAWDDRAAFAQGLIASEQDALEQLATASVYHIDLHIEDSLRQATGRLEVRYTNREQTALEEVVFRLFPNLTGGSMTVTNLLVDGAPVTPGYAQEDSVLSVPLPTALQPGQQAVISMDFAVTVPTDAASSNYGTFAYLDGVLALAHAYPMIAVYDDEGWNQEIAPPDGDVVYADASFYRVQVTAPDDLVVVTSGTTLEQQQVDRQQVLTIVAGPARDFYLAASPSYQVVSRQVGETLINSYAPARLESSATEVADVAAQALESLSARFGPYPYRELDLVSTATSALGVEYPGIIAITDAIYDRMFRQYLESTVAHEVAHQWFYNLVGNDQVDEPWLDEGLTQFATLLYYQDQHGPAGAQGFRASLEGRWEHSDGAQIPLGLPVAAYGEDGQYPGTYGSIIYGRGALFFEALADAMGQETFDAFLADYVQTHRWGIATIASLRALAEQHCGCDLGALFEAWVYP